MEKEILKRNFKIHKSKKSDTGMIIAPAIIIRLREALSVWLSRISCICFFSFFTASSISFIKPFLSSETETNNKVSNWLVSSFKEKTCGGNR